MNAVRPLKHKSVKESVVGEVGKSFIGNDDAIRKIFMTILAGGHVLLEDIPGVGKTTLAMAFSGVLELSCRRVQFTPDIMPADVTGFTMLHQDTRAMEYKPGAVMCNLLLADEINRASARSQSALLEAMEENAVTVDGVTYPLPQPFIVIATQNPAGSSGTQLLPESQTDRFMVRLSLGYPNEDAELEMLLRKHGERPAERLACLANAGILLDMRKKVSDIFVHKSVYGYILRLVRATRSHEMIAQGASPRCSVALTALAQASAYIDGRDFVVPDDVRDAYCDCTAHRLVLAPRARQEHMREREILEEILETVDAPVPKVK